MKKLFIFLLCLFFLFSSCNRYSFSYKYEEISSNVKSIKIVEITRDGYYGEMSVIIKREIPEEEKDEVLKEICKLNYEWSITLEPENITGLAIMLSYDDNNNRYDLVGLQGVEFYENGEQTYYDNSRCDHNAFNLILENYYNNVWEIDRKN